MIKNALVLFIVCAIVFVLFLPSYMKMQELSGRNSSYERQIRQLTQENEKLLEERRRLIEDPEYLERVARKQFGIIKDGETLYKIVQPGQQTTPKPVEPDADDKKKPVAAVKPVTAAAGTKKTLTVKKSSAGKATAVKKTTTATATKAATVKPAVKAKTTSTE